MAQLSDNPRTPYMFTSWELFEPLKRHKYFILVFTLSAALSALLITFIYSEKFEGDTTILFKPTEVTRLREHSDEAFGAPLPQPEYKVIGKTITDLVSSDALLKPVVTKLHLDVPDSRSYSGPFYYVWYKETKDFINDEGSDIWSFLKYGRVIEKTNMQAAVSGLKDNIDIDNKDSYVFEIKVRDKHPDRVATITNAVADELIILLQHNEQQRAGVRSSQIKKLLDSKRKEVDSYRNQIADTLNSNGIVSVAEETDKDVARYSELALAKESTEADLRDTEGTLRSYDQRLGGQMVASNDLTTFRRGVQAEDFKRLSSERLEAQIKLNGLVAKRASLDSSMHGLSSTMQRLASLQVAYDNLNNRVQQTERDYTLLNDAYQEAVLQDQKNPTNVVIQSLATDPTMPAEPIKIYHVGLAASLAILLSVGLAFVFGYFNVRIFVPSKGVKGRRDYMDDPRDAMLTAGE